VPVAFELLVVFDLYEPWSGVIENLCKSKLFTLQPKYSAIDEVVGELFDINWWSYTLKGVTTRSKGTDNSRGEMQKICEKRGGAGYVTRDNVNSISVTVPHPEREHAYVVYEVLKEFAAR
jgi:hypothetical protein